MKNPIFQILIDSWLRIDFPKKNVHFDKSFND